jgi:hypothetical protein
MAFILGAVLGAGASLIGGAMASSAASKAASTQARSADKATALQKQMYEEGVVRQKPFYEAGITAQNRLLDILGLSDRTTAEGYGSGVRPFGMDDFRADPGYNFRMKEGLKSLDQQAAARGGLISGNALRAAQQYGQDLGSQEYMNAYNRYRTNRSDVLTPLQSILGQGQTTASELGSAGQNYASNAGSNMIAAGNARASGYTNSADAWSKALGGVANTVNSNMMYNQMFGKGYDPYSNYANLGGGGQVLLPPSRPA